MALSYEEAMKAYGGALTPSKKPAASGISYEEMMKRNVPPPAPMPTGGAADAAKGAWEGGMETVLKMPGSMLGDLPLFAMDTLGTAADNWAYTHGMTSKKGAVYTPLTAKQYADNPFGSETVRGMEDEWLGFKRPGEAKSQLEKYGRAAGGGVAGAALLGPANVMNYARGLLGGVGAQAGADVAPDSRIAPFIGGLLGAYSPDIATAGYRAMIPNMTQRVADDVRGLRDLGVETAPGQAASSNLTRYVYNQAKQTSLLPSDFQEAQARGQSRVMSGLIGQNTDDLPGAMEAAGSYGGNGLPKGALRQEYDRIYSTVTPTIDRQLANDLGAIDQDAQALTPGGYQRVMRTVGQVADGTIGDPMKLNYQELTDKKGVIDQLRNHPTPEVSRFADRIEQAVDDLFERQAPPGEMDALRTNDARYRAMKAMEPLVARGTQDNSGASLANRIASATQNATAYGDAGMPELQLLGRARRTFLQPPPNSGTPTRLLAQNVMLGGGGLLAGGPAGAAAGVAMPPVIERLLESRWLMNEMLAKQAGQRGLLQGVTLGPAAGVSPVAGLLATRAKP